VSGTCRMILDVDPGINDSIAIFYAVRKSGIKLEALTTTFGNTDTAIATDNVLRLLELLRRPDIPVAKGVERSFIHPYVRRADHVHGSNAMGDVELPEPKIRPTDEHASDLIFRMAKENAGEITLCPVGPVTNVALALVKAPEIAKLSARWSSWDRRFFILAFTGLQRRWSMRILRMILRRRISCFDRVRTLRWSAWTSR
jgi:purine nucleosidase